MENAFQVSIKGIAKSLKKHALGCFSMQQKATSIIFVNRNMGQ